MSLSEFLKRFLGHVALAALVWLILAISIERLMPGFVAPFVNLPYVGLLIVAAVIAAVLLPRTASKRSRIFGIVLIGLTALAAAFFAWTQIGGLGSSGLMLFASFLVLTGLLGWAIASGGEET